VSHLDVPPNAKVSPFPVGLNPEEFPDQDLNYVWRKTNIPPSDILTRPLKALVCDRVRTGKDQWKLRAMVRQFCQDEWRDSCDARTIPVDNFMDEIKKYPFLVCARGGGNDPSPKAWMALIAGVIPIIEHFPGDVLYSGMPVVLVDQWNSTTLTPQLLQHWRRSLAPYFDDPGEWAAVLEKLLPYHWLRLAVVSYHTGRGYGFIEP